MVAIAVAFFLRKYEQNFIYRLQNTVESLSQKWYNIITQREAENPMNRTRKGNKMKYIIYIDYRAIETAGYEYRDMMAKNFKEAIEEAEKIYDPETMYLIRIMEREGKVYSGEGCKSQNYRAIECKRSPEGGWHANTSENSETEHVATRSWLNGHKDDPWYNIAE